MNITVAHPKRAYRERLCAALRTRGLQVFSVPDLAGLVDSARQAKLVLVLIDPGLLAKEEVDVRAQVRAKHGYDVQVVALTNRVATEHEEIFQRHGATILEYPLDEVARVADWVRDFARRLSTGGRDGGTGGHWIAKGTDGAGQGVVLGAVGKDGASIMVVEDEPTFRGFLCEALGLAGYEVWAAASGEEALAFLLTNGVDLVISDINMPGMDGFELKQRIDQSGASSTPFIMMTADSNADNAANAAAVGVVFILGKPIRNLDALYAIVKEALRKGPAAAP